LAEIYYCPMKRALIQQLPYYKTRPTVIKAIKELIKNDIVLSYKDPADQRRNIYIINPYNAWKGTFKERTRAIKKIDNQLPLFQDHETKTLLLGSSNEKKSPGGLGEGDPPIK